MAPCVLSKQANLIKRSSNSWNVALTCLCISADPSSSLGTASRMNTPQSSSLTSRVTAPLSVSRSLPYPPLQLTPPYRSTVRRSVKARPASFAMETRLRLEPPFPSTTTEASSTIALSFANRRGTPTEGLHAFYDVGTELGQGSFATVRRAACRVGARLSSEK